MGFKKNSRNFGHKKGLITVDKIISAAIKKNIKYLTLFVFSTENWRRPLKEINYLFDLLSNYIDKEVQNLLKKKIKIKIIGNIKPFPKKLKLKLRKIEKLTKSNKKIQINMALNYGSRQEIISCFKKLNKNALKINEKNMALTYTHNILIQKY